MQIVSFWGVLHKEEYIDVQTDKKLEFVDLSKAKSPLLVKERVFYKK
jgi:hypothetical protein